MDETLRASGDRIGRVRNSLPSAQCVPARLRHDRRGSERDAADVSVHQPPDHEDDDHQTEYAADPDGSALTVIAPTVEPKPAPEQNQEQDDD